ncbi:TetR/AcrR family transcriptional regulator [Actinokineospora sp. UTMC 2448]|uniref:TetR/AcrR family transcriptional regulator n=1 Tax=Actinokineospora sp. UTMC 2448 TaxID=2268449 RepID=UPI002164C660|nr:TetR/AcrR family transcriptional regulator [Actinokineospora sp. UTMC 2448]UVS79782.1 mycofactocin system transcriptional regulator [Actinokineospora sp. UTMC 2448]
MENPLAPLLAPPADPADVRILEAAVAQFALIGIRRTSADDIARRSGVNRTTLYRRMGTKEEIVRAAMAHEVRKVLAEIEARLAGIDDPLERQLHGFGVTVTTLRGNPLLRQLLAVDRDETLVWLTLDAGAAIEIATAYVVGMVTELRTALGLPDTPPAEVVAATIVRLVHSLVLTPDGPPRLPDDRSLREFAATVICPLIGVPLDRSAGRADQ